MKISTVYILLGAGIVLAIVGIIILNYGRSLSRTIPQKASTYNLIGLVLLVFGLFAALSCTRILF